MSDQLNHPRLIRTALTTEPAASRCALTSAHKRDHEHIINGRKASKKFAFVTFMLACLSGCAAMQTPYINEEFSRYMWGGYSDEKLGDKEYIVNYEGNVYTSDEMLKKYLNKRASELCGVENYMLSDPTSSIEDQMMMSGGVFMSLPNPVSSVKVQCETTKDDYLMKSLVEGDTEYCDIHIYNSTAYLSFVFSIDVSVNNVYITALPYKQYTVSPIPKGINTLMIAKPFSSKRKELEFEVSTCSEQIEVRHNTFETLKIEIHSEGKDLATDGYDPNIES